MKKGALLLSLCLLILSVLLAVGSVSFFGPCIHEDGAYGSCHWAGQAVFGNGIVLSLAALLLLLIRRPQARTGISLCMLALSAETACIPGGLIRLCMMSTMRCLSVMQPAVRVICMLIAVLSAISALTDHRQTQL